MCKYVRERGRERVCKYVRERERECKYVREIEGGRECNVGERRIERVCYDCLKLSYTKLLSMFKTVLHQVNINV